jgi:RNA polymerase sigma-70 factor (ECF subfamily)
MIATRLSRFLERLRHAAGRKEVGDLGDGPLLERFLRQRDESAFAELVYRHGPMVHGVCLRVLGNADDADDAFQATFLVLVRKAAWVRPRERVGRFLYGVACRTALEARRAEERRRRREARARPRPEPAEDPWTELRPVLDREVSRLPAKYREPLVLCDLEGWTRAEAAQRLGWPEGTVSSRLARARGLLARRLRRYSPTLSVGAVAATLATCRATAGVPVLPAAATIKAAMRVAAGEAAIAAGVSPRVAALVKGVLEAMWLTKAKIVTAVLLGVAIVGSGTVLLTRGSAAAQQPVGGGTRLEEPADQAQAAAADRAAAGEGTVSVKDLPPVVVRTVPQAGDAKVDAAKVSEIRVTFSKEMADKTWSWSQISEETFPKTTGDPHYDRDRRTAVLPVKLEPGKTYVIWLNSEKFHGFQDSRGMPAIPYLLAFETKP